MKMRMELRGMHFHAFHGCLEEERIHGNEFVVDVDYLAESGDAAKSDCLEDTVSYADVYDIVSAQMAIPSNLLENVAYRIREAISAAFPTLEDLHVSVAKKNPPVGGSVDWSVVKI